MVAVATKCRKWGDDARAVAQLSVSQSASRSITCGDGGVVDAVVRAVVAHRRQLRRDHQLDHRRAAVTFTQQHAVSQSRIKLVLTRLQLS